MFHWVTLRDQSDCCFSRTVPIAKNKTLTKFAQSWNKTREGPDWMMKTRYRYLTMSMPFSNNSISKSKIKISSYVQSCEISKSFLYWISCFNDFNCCRSSNIETWKTILTRERKKTKSVTEYNVLDEVLNRARSFHSFCCQVCSHSLVWQGLILHLTWRFEFKIISRDTHLILCGATQLPWDKDSAMKSN